MTTIDFRRAYRMAKLSGLFGFIPLNHPVKLADKSIILYWEYARDTKATYYRIPN